MKKPFYITTTLPYVNSNPHIGFALEIIRADMIARYKQSQGFDVFFNTGTDEHGAKIQQKAQEAGVSTQSYVDQYAEKFKALGGMLGLSSDINFIRTTDTHHVAAAQEFWRQCKERGFIYKKNYSVKYCIGCELEKTESELTEGRCPLHPNMELERISEENYFFAFSKFQKQLLDLYSANPDFVVPPSRQNEIRAFVERGLDDFSISRLVSKMSWGIAVPDDAEHVMYVWFDALVNYISAIGWPTDMKKFNRFAIDTGGMIQYCGKDNLRQQAAMWQAMLCAVGLPNSKQIVIDGFITGAGGVKMSKSLGNTIEPTEILKEYDKDVLRYYMAREIHPFEDSEFTMEKFKASYNANLANGLGNLVSRVLKMAETYGVRIPEALLGAGDTENHINNYPIIRESLDTYRLDRALDEIWKMIGEADAFVQKNEPFKKIKIDKEGAEADVAHLLASVFTIANLLEIFLPDTAEKIKTAIREGKALSVPLFMRKA